MRSMIKLPHIAIVFALAYPLTVSAQSLGDLAKKTAADREKAKAEPAKVFTDADIKTLATTLPDTVPPIGTPAPTATVAPTSVSPSEPPALHDEAYWRAAFTPLWTRSDENRTQHEAALHRVIDYKAAMDASEHMVFGEVVVDRMLKQKYLDAVDEESRYKAAVAADAIALSDLEEDARRASVPAGWYRRR
jgi:hypothetical protein